jgi:hypothetical protein
MTIVEGVSINLPAGLLSGRQDHAGGVWDPEAVVALVRELPLNWAFLPKVWASFFQAD